MKKTLVSAFCVFALAALSACNLPGQPPPTAESEPTPGQDELIATMVAATLTAQAPPDAPPAIETPQPPAESPIPENTATITLTPSPEIPRVSVSVGTNCRTGPGIQFDQVGALGVGQSAEVVGRYQNGLYWIIKNPNRAGECWLWGQYATVSGNTAGLPEYASPPTPTPTQTSTPTPTSTPAFTVVSITYSLGTWSSPGFTNCPRITANITTNGAGTVNFKWTRQDTPGGGATQTLTFAAAGTQSVNYDWSRGSVHAGNPTWVGIFVESPNNQDFGRIDFSTACTAP